MEINDFSLDENSDYQLIVNRLNKIQKNGIEIWLDDFSHTSDEMVKTIGTINWDRIKIDRSYLTHNYIFTYDLKSLLNSLNPFTSKGFILEGVELEIHADFAKANNILSQGYYYSSPKVLDFINHCTEEITKRLKYDKSQANISRASYSQ